MKQNKEDAADREAWASRIRSAMDEAGVTAAALAERMDVVKSAVYHWRGGVRIPSRQIHRKLAKCLKISVERLNGWAK